MLARHQLQLPQDKPARVQVLLVVLARENFRPCQLVDREWHLRPVVVVDRDFGIVGVTQSEDAEETLRRDLREDVCRDELREGPRRALEGVGRGALG